MCKFGSNIHNSGYTLWENCRDNCNNICKEHKIAVMSYFVDKLIERADNQIELEHEYDQSGKVTYYTHSNNLKEAKRRLEEFKVSLYINTDGILQGGTKEISYGDWLSAIYWQ